MNGLSWWWRIILGLLISQAQFHAGEPDPAWIADLASEDFTVREKAEASLWQWAEKNRESVASHFWNLSRQASDPEVRLRSLRLLRRHVLWERDRNASGFIGIHMRGEIVTPPDGKEQPSIRVTNVMPNSPAVTADLRTGDLILKINDRRLEGHPANIPGIQEGSVEANLAEEVQSHHPGDTIVLSILRDDAELEVSVVLGLHRPALQMGGFGNDASYDELLRREDDDYFEAWLQSKRSEKD